MYVNKLVDIENQNCYKDLFQAMTQLGMSALNMEKDCDLGPELSFFLACLATFFLLLEKHNKSGARKIKQFVWTQKVRCQGLSINQRFSKNKGMYDCIVKSIAKSAIDFIS